jgi:hypothetical protein
VEVLGGLQIEPGNTLAFREHSVGQVTYGFVSLQNTAVRRPAWYESAEAQMGTMGSLLLLLASAVVVWPLGAVIRRLGKRNREPNPAWRRALWVGWVVTVALALVAWVRGQGAFVGRLTYLLIALAAVLFVLFAGYWNLLGRRF